MTKETIRDVCQQLKKPDGGQKISARALDGAIIDFDIQTGTTFDTDDPEMEHILYVLCLILLLDYSPANK